MTRIKCPSCGELMGDPEPYVTLPWLMDGDVHPLPEAIENAAPSGHKYRCASCGCVVDIPAPQGQETA